MRRNRTWNFSHTLYISILPEATRGFHPTSTIDPLVLIKSLFRQTFQASSRALHPSSASIRKSPARRSISAGKLVPLGQIYHLRASLRPDLSLAYQFCNHGWTQSGLQSGLNPRYEFLPTMPRSCIFLFARSLYFFDCSEPALGVGGRQKKTAQGFSGNFCTTSVQCF